ncbi:MAG: sugar transferase [Neisseria sp.]|nr:sugar transferase [Neisseria sp.]
MKFTIRLLCYISLCCGLPLLFIQGRSTFSGFNFGLQVSLLVSAVVLFISAVNFHFFAKFPGERSGLSVLSIFGAWFGVAITVIILLRLPYSLSYLTISLLGVICCLFFEFFYTKQQKNIMAFIPMGRSGEIYQIQGVEWIRLDTPELPREKINAIVADLHSPDLGDSWQNFLADCALEGISVFNIRQIEESLTGKIKIHHMYENDLGSLQPSPFYIHIKYLLDILLILLSLPLVIIVVILTAIAIKLDDGGKIFYFQDRVGFRNKTFTAYKLRSMSEASSTHTTVQNDQRITRVGRFIRKTRIDELPQFLNVLKGEMSLIGPRAEYLAFAQELEKEVPFFNYRHIVKPGISGWAQVMQGYATGAEETKTKLEYDFYYIKHFSFSLDVLIFFKTIKTMLTGFGAR